MWSKKELINAQFNLALRKPKSADFRLKWSNYEKRSCIIMPSKRESIPSHIAKIMHSADKNLRVDQQQ
jgi:hypothetical protein